MNTAQLPERVPSTGRVLISPRTQRNQAESGSTRGCNASLPELSLLVRPPPVGSPPLQPLTSHPTKDNWGSGRADHRSVPTRKPAASTQSRPTTRLTNR